MTTPIASEPELPEPAAFMYPSDLAAFAKREMVAEAVSVSCTDVNTLERTVGLFTADQMRAYALAALSSRSGSAAETAGDRIMRLEKALKWYRDEAAALSKHMPSGAHTQAVLASLTVLSLDGGRRADAAMGSDGNTGTLKDDEAHNGPVERAAKPSA